MAFRPRGLEAKDERFHSQVIRDTRPLGIRISDFLKNPAATSFLLLGFAVLPFLLRHFSDLILFIGLIIFFYTLTRKTTLPFRMPLRSHLKDYNDLEPGPKGKAKKGSGIYHFGNANADNEELWFTNEDMRTHVLIFGSTGSGKTEALVSIAYNALVQASGFIYVDGKGDNSLFAKVFSMVRSMGREDDMLLINFMTGARDIIGPQEKRLSNTLNPFANGSSSMLTQLVVSLMSKSSSSSDGDMWKGRAIAFVEALMKVLVAMRDAGYILLDANSIRNYFHLPKLESMVIDKLFLRDGQEPVNLENIPTAVIEPIVNYVLTLPGYNKEKKGQQVSQVLEQHGFITMQLVRVFTSLADTYGHIMRTRLAEVDLKDVVLNRRILCVLLPALEKSPDELSNLGKVIVSTLRAMMASGLGEHVEGDFADLIDTKPTNSKTPFLCILDEYGYYAVEGFAVVPAQARSLGFSVVFAGQDLPAFQKASKEEAASIGANTNIKICMKLEDPTETWDFFMKSAGESYVTHVENFQIDQGSVLGSYQDSKGARVEKRARIDLLDLKEQPPGQAHFFFKSKIVRGRFFFANPKPVRFIRLNHFIKVNDPEEKQIQQRHAVSKRLANLIADKFSTSLDMNSRVSNEEVDWVAQVFQTRKASFSSPIHLGVIVLHEFYSKNEEENDIPDSFFDDMTTVETPKNYTDIFSPLFVTDYIKSMLSDSEIKKVEAPLLNKSDCYDQLEYIERLCGKGGQQAATSALAIINDIKENTNYPPDEKMMTNGAGLAPLIEDMIESIKLAKQEANKKKE